ncbi:MAG TPA: MFS transporter [Kofleriaceae bacterium]|nr:MFS transporter [Kofleriaceae bacterium]
MIRNKTAILALLTALNFLNYIDRMVLAAVLAHVEKDLDLTKFQAGLGASAFLIGYFVTAPFFGSLADRGQRKGLIAAGVAVWSIATAATGFATGLWSLLAARAFVGVGEAAYATLAPTIIDDITPPERKNRALAIFYLALPLGSAMGYMLGGTIDKHWGWRTAFFVAGGPGLVIALTCLLIAEPERKLAAVKARIMESLKTLAAIPLYRRAVVGYCAYTAAIGAFSYWAPEFLINRFPKQLDSQSANFWFGLVTVIAGAIGTIVGGRWADRSQQGIVVPEGAPHDHRDNRRGINELLRICSYGMVLAAPLCAVVFFMPAPIGFFAVAFVVEVGLFLSTSPVNAIGLRAVPVELRASAMAAMIFAIHLFGDLWSPPLLGALRDGMESVIASKVTATTIAMMALPVTFALSAYWWWPRKREAA